MKQFQGFTLQTLSVEMTNILFNRIHFSKTTSFRQSIWHGFIRCMGKCFSLPQHPLFDGVCGMLWYIILDVCIAKFWHICHWLLIFANFYWFCVTDVVVTCNYNHFFLADVIAFNCIWLMLLATVADVEATFYCVNPQCWFGRCFCHICLADVFLP